MNVNSEPFVPRFTMSVNDTDIHYYEVPEPMLLGTYQPLGVTAAQEAVSNDTAWTPVWSDMFLMAEQERIQREIQLKEQEQAWKNWYNQTLCAQRNLVHVQPERQIYCNVDRIEREAADIVGPNGQLCWQKAFGS